ncbi:transcription termination factor Rho [Kineothrix alysoides]|uniref:Transcription termination factor Rho n=1 Tax=Kineothrix alysoides TaxID=1469948 RepID=A0A4R1QS89_9FIRM|nr:transcription termination factor Rho [Kineothrix alysoides]TCL55883.1 transcription termination factor Rho [Kineothrix alysoides]
MREKYESLALADLKEIAKARKIKGVSAMKKADIVEAMLAEDEKEKNGAVVSEEKPATAPKRVIMNKPASERNGGETSSDIKQAGNRQQENRQTESRQAADGESESRPAEGRQTENKLPEGRQAENRVSENKQNENRFQDNRQAVNGRPAENRASSDNRMSENRAAADSRQTGEVRTAGDSRQTVTGRGDDEKYPSDLDSGIIAHGILEVMPDGYGFIRCENYLPGENDVYVAPSQIRRFNLKTGDILEGNTRVKTQSEKFSALLYVKGVNGYSPDVAARRCNFEDMTPIFPDERMPLETQGASVAMRIMDLMSPVGKGQRGMIVSPPKAGKTTLLKEVAKSVKRNSPDVHLIILLIDERPEEVTDIKEAIEGPNVEVIYSTFDELPEHHKRVSEMVIERAKRLVEHKKDVMILLDSITRLTRAYNLTVPPSGRTLSGGLDPAALHMPKRFFGAARNMRGGGSLTILATALVETGSKMDDVVYEEFKGTGNMEMVLDRKLSERRVFPAIDIPKSGTRREDLLLSSEEQEAINIMRKALNSLKPEEAVDKILDIFAKTRNNAEFVQMVKKIKFF